MKIGIIGAGNVGSTLGKRWALKGHQITFGVRDLNKYSNLSKFENIEISKIQTTIDENDINVLAVPGRLSMITLENLNNLENKVILDTTNMSGMQDMVKKFSKTSFVKVFNTIGYNIMEDPVFESDCADSFICGDDQQGLEILLLYQEI